MTTETIPAADSGLSAVLDDGEPRFVYREAVDAAPVPVTYETVWRVIQNFLETDVLRLEDVVRFADADPEILVGLRAAAVDLIMSTLDESPSRRRRVLSNASRFRPLADFSLADQHDPDAGLLLLRALNLWTANVDVPALAILTERLLETDAVDLNPKGA